METQFNTPSRSRILVVGAGVSGLTTALCLRRRGFEVTVIADKFSPEVTSNVAGALWEWPPAVCGYHQDEKSLARSKAWCIKSYKTFAELAVHPTSRERSNYSEPEAIASPADPWPGQPATGVFMRRVTFYFRRPVVEDHFQLHKMSELREHVLEFSHDPGLIARNGVNPAVELRDAYSHLAPMVDTDMYMNWLMNRIRQVGCQVTQQRLSGSLVEQEKELKQAYSADAIVNCTGLGARDLADDQMSPLRGALIRIRNDGKRFPPIRMAHCVSHDETVAGQHFVFIVPRGEDMLILGGLAEPDQWDTNINLSNYEPVREMFRRCVEFLPILANAEVDQAEPVRVGLRPLRKANVRLEVEPGTCIVHNYGHGGSGVTFSWGCAEEVSELMQTIVDDRA